MAFELEVVGIKEKQAELGALVAQLGDMDGLWARYAEIMAATEAEWFASNGDGLWPPLAEDTLRDKLRDGWPPDTLIRTGALRDSLIDPGQAMDISQGRSTLGTFTESAMTWGTSVTDERGREYAHFHQHTAEGSMIPVDYGDRPPERQVIPWPLPPEVEAEMFAADESWLEDCIRRSGLS